MRLKTWHESVNFNMDVDAAVVRVLDGLRKQRNLSDYDGELVTDQALVECIQQATYLLTRATSSL